MNEHFKSYQESVIKDIPDGFGTFLKHNNLYNKFIEITQETRKFDSSYLDSLKEHQKLLIKALQDYHKNSPLDLKTGRFKPFTIQYTTFSLIPTYGQEAKDAKRPFFSCWEMETIFKINPELARNILEKKQDYVLIPSLKLVSLEEVNKPLVLDWTLPL